MSEQRPNGWQEWGRHVLAELQRLSTTANAIIGELHDVQRTVAVLEETKKIVDDLSKTINEDLLPSVRVQAWRIGAISGGIGVAVSFGLSLLMWYLTK